MTTSPSKVRIDKWLWAARFFKTRSLAKHAVEGGKVHMDGQRIKPSKEIAVGMVLIVRQGWDEKEVIVEGLSEQRRDATYAQTLYTETQASIAKREQSSQQRKLASAMHPVPDQRPNKKQRRQIHQFKQTGLPDIS